MTSFAVLVALLVVSVVAGAVAHEVSWRIGQRDRVSRAARRKGWL